MSKLKQMSMSELIDLHNQLADQLGVAHEDSFKNLAAARVAIVELQAKVDALNVNSGSDTPATVTHSTSDNSKYSSSGKRGPTQGVGEYAKSLIVEGKDNATVLAAVMEKFPTAKTSKGCIAFYRTALAKGPAVVDPAALRAQAQALTDKAAAIEAKVAQDAAELAAKSNVEGEAAVTTEEAVV